MELKHWMVIKSVICIVLALLLLLIPETFLSLYGSDLNESGVFMSRLFGQALALIGIVLWLARNVAEPSTRRAFVVAVLIGDLIGAVVSLIGVLAGVTNALGWTTVVLYLVLALGFGYFLLRE